MKHVAVAVLLCGLLVLAGRAPAKVSVATTIQLTPTARNTSVAYVPLARGRGATATPTLTPQPPLVFDVTGDVFVKPRWASSQTVPVAYTVLLDVGGSMSYDFGGNGTLAGADLRCEAYPPDALPSDPHCDGGVSSAWRTQSERRIYIVKQALSQFVDQMEPIDIMRVVAFSSALAGHVQLSPAWSSDKATLKAGLLQAGALNGDPYRTSGEAAAAAGMRAARQLLAAGLPQSPNGLPYRLQVIYITDSVPNVFLDGGRNAALDVCPQFATWPPPDNYPQCQLGSTGDGRLRPLSALIEQAGLLKQAEPGVQIAAIALAGVPTTGFDQVASAPSLVRSVTQPGQLGDALDELQQHEVQCVEHTSPSWLDRIDAAHAASLPGLPAGTFGYATLSDTNFVQVASAPIRHDAAGALQLKLASLAPGTYHLQAYVGYKGDDQVSRVYNQLQSGLQPVPYLTFTLAPPNTHVVLGPLRLVLPAATHVCG